jgi:predicted lipoprotein with Yx(FWY)xxD motif
MGAAAARLRAAIPLAVLLTSMLTAGAGADTRASAMTLRAVASKPLGATIVVDAGGFTLYHLTSEPKGSIACVGSCTSLWPPLPLSAGVKPVAGAGLVARRLGTVRRPDGRTQVTYGAYALYLYSGDARAGQVNGQGLERLWYALTPAGVVTRASVSSAKSAGTTAPTSSSQPPPSQGTTPTRPPPPRRRAAARQVRRFPRAAARATARATTATTTTRAAAPMGTAVCEPGSGSRRSVGPTEVGIVIHEV